MLLLVDDLVHGVAEEPEKVGGYVLCLVDCVTWLLGLVELLNESLPGLFQERVSGRSELVTELSD